MSKIISYRGVIPSGQQVKIQLSTIQGKVGYKINKFQVINKQPNEQTVELQGQIYKTNQTGIITNVIDFSDANLLAVTTYVNSSSSAYPQSDIIIFDNEKFNQDIYVVGIDMGGDSREVNYYLELETMSLSDLESTMLTLKNLRTITS